MGKKGDQNQPTNPSPRPNPSPILQLLLPPPPSSSTSAAGQILAHSGCSLPRRPSPQNPLPLLSVLPRGTRFRDRLHRAVEFGRPASPGLHRRRVAAAWKTIDNRVRAPWTVPAPVSPPPRPRSSPPASSSCLSSSAAEAVRTGAVADRELLLPEPKTCLP
jgi:hypothetical protein